ncbi:MAG: DUF2202 domain-containing protein [Patescibacteria group bacterium]
MQNFTKKILKNRGLSLGLFLAGLVVAMGVDSAYSKYSALKTAGDVIQEETYGKLGYGRGSSQRKNGGKNQKESSGQSRQGNNQRLNKENCLMDGCLLVEDADYPVGELSEETIEYLKAGLADERKALATYEATIEKFGTVKPFINIARAEEHHISMLKALFDKYGLKIPEDTTQIGALPATLQEVCTVGVQAEIDNDQLYQDMIPNIKEQDIREVFTALAAASLENHLPAFERCAN